MVSSGIWALYGSWTKQNIISKIKNQIAKINSSKFLRWSLMIFIIKGFQTVVFICISTTFQPICPLAFFRCLLNLRTFTELWTTSFIESTGVTCSDSFSHNQVQVLSIPVLLLACSEDWTCNLQIIVSLAALGTNTYNCYTMCPAGQFRGNFRDL